MRRVAAEMRSIRVAHKMERDLNQLYPRFGRSENYLRSQLQLPRAVGRTVGFAKTRQIRNVAARCSVNNGIKYVESFRPKFDTPAFSPERKLTEDRRVKVPV